jgi:hypothetical protein
MELTMKPVLDKKSLQIARGNDNFLERSEKY